MGIKGLFRRARRRVARKSHGPSGQARSSGALGVLRRRAWGVGLVTAIILTAVYAAYSAPGAANAATTSPSPTTTVTTNGSPPRTMPPSTDPLWAPYGTADPGTGSLTIPTPGGAPLTFSQQRQLTVAAPPPQQAITVPAPKGTGAAVATGTQALTSPASDTASASLASFHPGVAPSRLTTPSLTLPPSGGTFAAPSVLDISEATAPAARGWGAMAYDAGHNVDVLFGGTNSSGNDVNDTWTWNGTDWVQQNPTTSPSVRDSAMMAYDASLGKIVLFGGIYNGTSLNDTWTWDGSNWTQLSPSTSPEPLEGAGMDYDPQTGNVILFGGKDFNNWNVVDVSSATWSFNGTTWTQLSPSTHPSARNRVSMVYDPGISKLVLFGGHVASSPDASDTWIFDGTTWTQLSPSNSPSARQEYGLTWDPTLSLLILYGGVDCTTDACSSPTYLGDEWAFDGTTWYQGAAYVNGGPREAPSLVRDPTNGQMLMFGGVTASLTYSETSIIDYLGVGERRSYSFDTKKIDDRSSIGVNLASRNLVVDATDFTINSNVGNSLTLSRTYNVREGGSFTLGPDWTFSVGADVFASPLPTGDEIIFGLNGGDEAYYAKTSSTCNGATGTTAFTSPAGVDSDLCLQANGTLTLTSHATQDVITFNASGQEVSDADRNGNSLTVAYNADGTTHTIADAEGRVVTFSYTSGQLTQITDSASRTYQFAYTGQDMTTYTAADGSVTSYSYNASNDLTQITDPRGTQTEIYYDPGQSTIEAADIKMAYGHTISTTTSYDGHGRTTSVAGSLGDTVMTDGNGKVYTEVFNYPYQVIDVIDPLGHPQSTAYTSDYNVSTITNAASATTTVNYNSTNDPSSVVNPPALSGASPATANAAFNTPAVGVGGCTTNCVEGGQYLESSVTDPQGNCTSYTYDAAGNRTNTYSGQASGCDGKTAGDDYAFAYQGDSGVPSCTSDGLSSTYPGILCSTTYANQASSSNTTSYSYTFSSSSPKTLTQLTVTQPGGTCSTPRNLCTTTTYDSLGRVSTVVDSAAAGGGAGNKTTYCYDNLDRVTKLYVTAASSSPTCSTSGPTYSYTYDTDGNQTQLTGPAGTINYGYNELNELVTKNTGTNVCTVWIGSGALNGTICLGYDADNNLTTLADNLGTTTYSYDDADRLTSLVQPGGTSGCTISPKVLKAGCTAFAYDSVGERTVTQYPGGATMNSTYDNAGGLTQISGVSNAGSTLTNFTYCYEALASGGSCPTSDGTDLMLNQKTVESDPRASATTFYAYDNSNQLCGSGPNLASGASQLTCSSIQSGDNSYAYDAAGNRTQQDLAGTTSYLTYNAANELCWVSSTPGTACSSPPSGATTYSFDGNGNVSGTDTPASSYGYNAQNQTTSVTDNGITLSSLAYANVDQSERTSSTQGAAATAFLSSPMGLDRATTSSGSTYTIRDPFGTLVGYVDGSGNDWYYLFDGQDSVVALITGDGSTVGNRYAYDDWGRSVYTFPSPAVTQPYGYDSGYTDSTGLILFGSRYYDPTIGRWTQQDSVSALNLYEYTDNNPVNEVDPNGTMSWWTRMWLDAMAAAFTAIAVFVLLPILISFFTAVFSWTGPAAPYIGAAIGAAIVMGIVGCIANGIKRGQQSGANFRNMAGACLYWGSAGFIGGGIAGPIISLLSKLPGA